MKKRNYKKLSLCLFSFLALLLIVCGIYINDYYRADETAVSMLTSDDTITVTITEDYVVFAPEEPAAGFIFYPGGKVEHTAYAPLLRGLAEQNILCILVEMPFRLAVLDINAADGIPTQYPQITDWYMGGHSLGGSMAASYIGDHTDLFQGLVLLASYSTENLSSTNLEVLSLCGTEDKVLNIEKYADYYSNLPSSTSEIIIEGGCHAYFGSYGPQKGDGVPTITAEDQTEKTIDYLLQFFQ